MSDEVTDQTSEKKKAEKEFKRTEKWVRRLGHVILIGGGLMLFIPMVVGAIQGIQQDRVKDPFTGELVVSAEGVVDCYAEAADLMYLAGQYEDVNGHWEQRYSRWVTRCQMEHQEMYHLLNLTRDRMMGREEPPQIDDDQG